MKSIFISFLFLLSYLFTASQNIEKVYLNKKDTTTNYYIAVKPHGDINSFIFLLPGSFETPENVLAQTDIPEYAATKNILAVIPVFSTGVSTFGIDNNTQQSLKEMIEKVVLKYNLNGKRFYIGGFSIGGAASVKYAELSIKNNYPFIPTAVFGIDPPLDFERFYNSSKRIVRLFHNRPPNNEPEMMMKTMDIIMGGSPDLKLSEYHKLSPYSFSDTSQTNIRHLINMPVMIISEPDINWWLENRGYDVSHMNIRDQSGFINELHLLGNPKAVLITTLDKGYRKPDNIRHPHSWSIADPKNLIEWLQNP